MDEKARWTARVVQGDPSQRDRLLAPTAIVARLAQEPPCSECHGTGMQDDVVIQPERMRACGGCWGAGKVFGGHVELAAYCGAEWARSAIGRTMQHVACSCRGWDTTHGHTDIRWAPFSAWVEGLERWGRETRVRAAVAAARLVDRVRREASPNVTPHDLGSWRDQVAVIEAAEAWLSDQTEERRQIWVLAWNAVAVGFPEFERMLFWLPVPFYASNGLFALSNVPPEPIAASAFLEGVMKTADTEAYVRAAVCVALINPVRELIYAG